MPFNNISVEIEMTKKSANRDGAKYTLVMNHNFHEPIPLFVFELRNPIFSKNRISKTSFFVKNQNIFIHCSAFFE